MNESHIERHTYEKESLIKTARARLASMGLTLEELGSFGLVLDIGAKDCQIEQAALALGIKSVVSVDKSFPDSIKRSGLKFLENSASHLNVPDNSVDLALVKSSAYYYTKTEEETLAILKEINRTLKEGGSQRIFPARFGHIISELLRSNPKFSEAKAKSPERRRVGEVKEIQFNNNSANLKTVEFLEDRGIFVKKREGIEPNADDDFKYYLTIPKFKVDVD